jgi:predicted ATP-grasp superfamily ATP-dependent carboligase
MSAIVTNAKNRIAYTVVRSLSDNGIRVYTADFVPLSMSFASRFSRGNFIYPSPFRDEKRFIDCIIENVHRFNADVLMPVFEETFLLSKYRDVVSEHVAMAIPSYDQILTAHNKDRWMAMAGSLGIPVPETFPARALKEKGIRASGIQFPVLIKRTREGGRGGSPMSSRRESSKRYFQPRIIWEGPGKGFLCRKR